MPNFVRRSTALSRQSSELQGQTWFGPERDGLSSASGEIDDGEVNDFQYGCNVSYVLWLIAVKEYPRSPALSWRLSQLENLSPFRGRFCKPLLFAPFCF